MAGKNHNPPSKSRLANLPSDVKIKKETRYENCDEYEVSYKHPTDRLCPHCDSSDCVIKDNGYSQTVRHTPNALRGILVKLQKQRLYCKACGRSFVVTPDWVHPSLHMTQALYIVLYLSLTESTSIASIARQFCVSECIVMSVLNSVDFPSPSSLPEVLCIDEFKGNTGKWDPERKRWNNSTMHCNIADGDAGIVIDVLEQISATYITSYFRKFSVEQRKMVKLFCCDMNQGFLKVARDVFPHAIVCIDMFHVVKLLNDAVNDIRLSYLREINDRKKAGVATAKDYVNLTLLKKSSKSLRMSNVKQERLDNPKNASRMDHLQVVFERFPDIAVAYDALQEFHLLRDEPSLFAKKADFSDWLRRYSSCSVETVRAAVRTIRLHRTKIVNTWEYRRSNSPAEGLNTKIKLLKRVSFGMHKFETCRKRILMTCGPVRLVNEPWTIFNEKRKGPAPDNLDPT